MNRDDGFGLIARIILIVCAILAATSLAEIASAGIAVECKDATR